jgi:hypothetical protein
VAIYLKVVQVHGDFLNYYCLLLRLAIFLSHLIQLGNLNYCQ